MVTTDGTVLSYDATNKTGQILGVNGKNYQFNSRDWRVSKIGPQEGLLVNFAVAGVVAFNISVAAASK